MIFRRFSAFYGQSSVTEAWTNPGVFDIKNSDKLRKNDVQKIVLFVFDVCRIVQERVKNIMTAIIRDGDR